MPRNTYAQSLNFHSNQKYKGRNREREREKKKKEKEKKKKKEDILNLESSHCSLPSQLDTIPFILVRSANLLLSTCKDALADLNETANKVNQKHNKNQTYQNTNWYVHRQPKLISKIWWDEQDESQYVCNAQECESSKTFILKMTIKHLFLRENPLISKNMTLRAAVKAMVLQIK